MRFKEFMESAAEKFEDLLHHIAEEELIACKVTHVRDLGANKIEVYADCQDVPREPGYQADLTKKLQARLELHPLQQFHTLTVKVYHSNVDEFEKLGEGWKELAAGGAMAAAVVAATIQADKIDKEGARTIDGVVHYHAPHAATNIGTLPRNVEKTVVDGKPAYKWVSRSGFKGGNRETHLWTFIPEKK